jgi:hypothetical protein
MLKQAVPLGFKGFKCSNIRFAKYYEYLLNTEEPTHVNSLF